jgi:hypothetical protein
VSRSRSEAEPGAGVLPDDPGIPALRALAAEGFGPLLERVGVSDDVQEVRLLRHQPGRCTFEATCGGRRLALKAYSPARAAALDLCDWLEGKGLASGRAPTTPPIIARSRSLGLLVTAWLEGPSGHELIGGGRPARAGELAAEWLRTEARLTARLGRSYGPDATLQEVARWTRKIGRVDPELGAEASAILTSLRVARPTLTHEGVRHGDFSPEHVLDLGDGPGVIDWDSFRRGALELDAARFLGALSWLAGERPGRAQGGAEAAASLRAGLDGLLDEGALAWYRAAVHVRLAKKLCRETPRPARWRARARALLAEARGSIEERGSRRASGFGVAGRRSGTSGTGMNPFVFIVGCLRSGTTLLRRMADAHPELAVIHETQWLPRWYERRIGITPDGAVSPELIDRLIEFPRFQELRIEREELERLLEAGRPVSYSSFVSGVFDLYGQAQGKGLVGEKSPGYVRYLPTLHELWPDARFVHLVRDGRDVCQSVLGWRKAGRNPGKFTTWAEDRVTTAALWWEWHVRLGCEEGRMLGADRYYELRHESLAADPVHECGALCGFLELPYDEAMVRYQEHQADGSWGRSAKGRWLPPTPAIRDWRSQMPRGDVERFEAAAGDLLGELGYERALPRLGRAPLEHAERLRRRFADEVRERGARLPRRWVEAG